MYYWRWFNRPRHPFARLLLGVIGLIMLAGVLTLGLFALVAFAVIGSIVALTRAFARAGAPQTSASAHPNVIEGEFVVLSNRAASIKH
jgi:hypothetical protein